MRVAAMLLIAGAPAVFGCDRPDAVDTAKAATVKEETATTIRLTIGTQHTTTNTVTGGIVLKELGFLEKRLPRTGKYGKVRYAIDWQNATSAPPLTNAMMANNVQIAMMGDYPLLVNGATGQSTKNRTEFIAVTGYNAFGGGNGIVVPKDSPYYDFADLKGKKVSVPFGSSAHGMMLQALHARGLSEDFWELVSQSPEIGATNLQEKRIDAHGDFVPFAELLPFRGIARKIYDGAETRHPTFHGVVVRKDFADRYPEVVVAYVKALLDANDWVRQNPRVAAEKVEAWTKIEREVAYMFLGPNGIHTLDPTIKPAWLEALTVNYGVLRKMKRIGELEFSGWVNDRYVRQAHAELGLDYDERLRALTGDTIRGHDPICKVPIEVPGKAGEIWIKGGEVVPFSSTACTFLGVHRFTAEGKKLGAVYVIDSVLGIKLFADAAFYVLRRSGAQRAELIPFLLKGDAQRAAKEKGGKVVTYAEALTAAQSDVQQG